MTRKNEKIIAVPTNVITGFLGVGKTSTISHLLEQKPQHERWAILVNEFGEIGIDGSLFKISAKKQNNLFIKEVPGGCMCCSSSLSMQIALNKLLKEAKPHRLLIEPTGLGHPHEVLKLLSNQYYRDTLSLEKTITLVDARHLSDKRYTENETFNQQLAIADTIIVNKTDLYDAQDKTILSNYLTSNNFKHDLLHFTTHGKIDLAWLTGKTEYVSKNNKLLHHHKMIEEDIADSPIPESGFIKAINQGEGYQSIGWRFNTEQVFDRIQLITFLQSTKAIRLKAVFITTDGFFSYNNTSDGFHEKVIKECNESRIEIICDNINSQWEALLQQTISTR